MFQYSCGRCGSRVDKSARACPHCGTTLGNIHCQQCGYSGPEEDFSSNHCPRCNTILRTSGVRMERCPECGRKMEAGQWTCPSCGHTQWGIILALGTAAAASILLAVVILPLPTIWTLLVGGLGVVLFYSAFYGVGGALRWRGVTTFLMTTLMFAMLGTASLAARYRYSPDPVMIQTPKAVVAAAALVETPLPTATFAPSATPAPTATPQLTASVQVLLANIREQPGTGYNVTGAAGQDEVVTLIGRNKDATWVKVKTQKNYTGWVFADLLKLPVDVGELPEVN